jgi:putative NIF3 family GTP cyclohydrolase 1 type 2
MIRIMLFLKEFKKRKIAIYVLHAPLDDFGLYSTSYTLASKMKLNLLTTFHKYATCSAGLICTSSFENISQLKEVFEKTIGHKSKLYLYGDKNIKDKKIGVIAGGGNTFNSIKELIQEGAEILITGVTRMTDSYKPSIETHNFAKENKISILGGTHYSTEKFACQAMCSYFQNLGGFATLR